MLRSVAVVAVGLGLAPTAAAAPLSINATVEPGSHAAAFRWTTSAPATTTVEVGRNDAFGIWLRAPTRERVDGRALLGSLEPSTTYRYRMTARRGPSVVSAIGTFTTRPFPEWTVGAVIDRTLHVDGQPFFPRMVYGQCDWAYQQSLDAGVNLYMGSGCSTPWVQLDALRARAVSAIPAAWKDVADGRGAIGWYHLDEADLYVRPEALPFHPPWQQSHRVTFLTLSGHVYSGSAGPPFGRSVYPGFIARADMIGLDLYPLQVWCRRDAFRAVYEAQRELAALAGPRATYQWIEVGRMEFCKGRPELDPTPLTVRAETWLAIAGGARGIGYFPDHWRLEIASSIAKLNTEISALAPALLADELPAAASPGPVRVGARRFNGARYVIAVNTSWRRVRASVATAGLRGTAWVFGESRSVPVRGGAITDAFGPLQAHVYLVGP
ncbi:MAG TPA: fibronectin type III domain-containing protein [Gaiellaceae bacterium]|nr:fibronectin type III domain-containing protein [Gaiellaceae bacterium]